MDKRSSPEILLIGAAPRSGTTALVHLLNCHPRVLIGMERYQQKLVRERAFSPELFEAERFFDVRPGDTEHDGSFRPTQLWKADAFNELALVGDKEPALVLQAPELRGAGAPVRWLFIVRDVRDVAASYKRRGRTDPTWPTDRTWRSAVADWNAANRVIAPLVGEPDVHVVEYETVFSDPAEANALWQYFGLNTDDPRIDWEELQGIYSFRKRSSDDDDKPLLSEELGQIDELADWAAYDAIRAAIDKMGPRPACTLLSTDLRTVNIDISTLVLRRGANPVGISRVEAELARTYARQRDVEARFWRFDSDTRTYHPLLSDDWAELLGLEQSAPLTTPDAIATAWQQSAGDDVGSQSTLAPIGQRSLFDDGWVSARATFRYWGPRQLTLGLYLPINIDDRPKNMTIFINGEKYCHYRLNREVVETVRIILPEAHADWTLDFVFDEGAESRTDNRRLGALLLRDVTSAQLASSTAPAPPTGRLIVAGLPWDNDCMEACYKLAQSPDLDVECIVYDVVPLLIPQYCVPNMTELFGKFIADVAWTASVIYCISDSTNADLAAELKRLRLPTPRIERVQLGSTLDAKALVVANDEADDKPFGLAMNSYVLFVSTVEPRKNHELLFRVWRALLEEAEDEAKIPRLVLVGEKGWNSTDLLRMLDEDIRLAPHFVTRLPNVSDALLAQLYRGALFTVYPSFYEGWGLPVPESLGYGKACITSNTSSLPEAGQGLTEMVDPLDFYAWKAAISRMIFDHEHRANAEARIAERFRPRLWRDAFTKVLRGDEGRRP